MNKLFILTCLALLTSQQTHCCESNNVDVTSLSTWLKALTIPNDRNSPLDKERWALCAQLQTILINSNHTLNNSALIRCLRKECEMIHLRPQLAGLEKTNNSGTLLNYKTYLGFVESYEHVRAQTFTQFKNGPQDLTKLQDLFTQEAYSSPNGAPDCCIS